MTEPTYSYVRGQGWVVSTGPEILYHDPYGQYVIIDLADIPGGLGIQRSFAPWHPEYPGADASFPNSIGVESVIWRLNNGDHINFTVSHTHKQRKQHVCAITVKDYEKLVGR